jgi:hypothetical protein
LWYWGLNSGPIPWATPPALFCDGFLFLFFFFCFFCEIGSHKLFAQAGFKPQFSWSLPPK